MVEVGAGWLEQNPSMLQTRQVPLFSGPRGDTGSALASGSPRRLRALGPVLGLGMQVWGTKEVRGSPLGALGSALSSQAQGGVLGCDGPLTQGLTQTHPGDWCHALKPLSGTEGTVRPASGRREK